MESISMQAPLAMTFVSQLDLTSLKRIQVPCVPGSAIQRFDGDDEDRDEAALLQVPERVCQAINLQQPGGGPLVAWPCSAALCQVVCQKADLSKAYKALVLQQGKLQIKMGDVKSSMLLTPPSYFELKEAVAKAIQLTLEGSWWAIGAVIMNVNFLECEPGKLVTCSVAILEVELSLPNVVVLFTRAGAAILRLFSPLSAGASTSERVAQCLEDSGHLNAATKESAGTKCYLLPDFKGAFIIRVLPSSRVPDAQQICESWCTRGLPLPQHIPFFVEVAASLYSEDPPLIVPSCCVWSTPGPLPVGKQKGPDHAILQTISRDITASSFKFFGGQPLVRQAEDQQLQLVPAFTSALSLAAGCGTQATGPAGALPNLHEAPKADSKLLPTPAPLAARPRAGKVHFGPSLEALLEEHGKAPTATPLSSQGPSQGTALPPSRTLHRAAGQFPTAHAAAAPAAVSQPGSRDLQAAASGSAAAPPGPVTIAIRKRPSWTAAASKPQTPALSKPKQVPKAKASAPAAVSGPATKPAPHSSLAAKLPIAGSSQAALPAAAAQAKRKADDGGGQAAKAPRKPRKVEELDQGTVVAKVKEQGRKGSLDQLTVAEMKVFLKASKVAVGGKKADLMARIGSLLGQS